MTLQSRIPTDVTSARRLKEYVALARELSLIHDPHEMVASYRKRSRFVVPAAQSASFSRRGMPPNKVRVTRSTRWESDINPWKQAELLPIIDRGIIPRLMLAGHAIKIDELDVPDDDPFALYAHGMRSLIAAPVFHDGEPLYMTVLMQAAPGAYTLEHLSTLVLTTNLVGRATSQLVLGEELARAYAALDREFNMVGRIQRQLLPATLPNIPDVRIAAHYETSRRAGGDYYDFFQLPDGRWGFVIADVSGHGPAAAVVMAMMHAFMRAPQTACPGVIDSVTAIVTQLNRQLYDSVSAGQFVTAFVGIYEPDSRRLSFASAGHNPPRRLRGENPNIVPLDGDAGLPLGITQRYEAFDNQTTIERGERILLYTDGITETFSPSGEMFGTEGLDAALRCCSQTPEGLINTINRTVTDFAEGAPPEDDRTLVALAFD